MSEHIQTEKTPLEPQSVAQSAPTSEARQAGLLPILDGVLIAMLLILAFTSAFYPVRNADFFLHAASGRLLAQGGYEFGVDPFTLAGEDTYWANHSWLFDWTIYQVYNLDTSGKSLVLLKALLVVCVVGLMLYGARARGRSLFVPVVCTTFALLAISPYLDLGPTLLSYLFLAVVVLVIDSQEREPSSEPPSSRSLWVLPGLMVLWVNTDQWFFLGPLLIGLWLLGRAGSSILSSRKDDGVPLARLALILAVSVGATLLNPHLHRAWVLPPGLGLSAGGETISQDDHFRGLFRSPFAEDYFEPTAGLSAGGMAYFVLLLLGALSFVAGRRALHVPRLLCSLAMALLAAYHARAIPFFAIVAAPIFARNFLEATSPISDGEPARPEPERGSPGLRILWGIVGLILIAGSLPGWLQAKPRYLRHVGWGVQADPVLESAAREVSKLASWHRERMPDSPVVFFNTHPDVGPYLAWFSPGQRWYLDRRLQADEGAIRDYEQVLESLSTDDFKKESTWRNVFRGRKVPYLIFHDDDLFGHDLMLQRLVGSAREWVPLYQQGGIGIFAWRDLKAGSLTQVFDEARWDVKGLAFGDEPLKAPAEGVTAQPGSARWYEILWHPDKPRPPEAQQARMYVLQHHLSNQNRRDAVSIQWMSIMMARVLAQTASTAPMGEGPGYALRASILAGLVPTQRDHRQPLQNQLNYLSGELAGLYFQIAPDASSMASLFLALRSARQALAINPDDAQTHLLLGQTYFQFARATRERGRSQGVPHLTEIRRVQAIASLQQALKLDADLVEAHRLLSFLYDELGFLDLLVKHRKEWHRCLKAEPLKPGDNAKDREDLLKQLEEENPLLDKELKQRLDTFELSSANMPPGQKAAIALSRGRDQPLGLALTAFEILRNLKAEELVVQQGAHTDPQAAEMLFRLHFFLGNLHEVREGLTPNWRTVLRVDGDLQIPLYQWFHLLLASASGDYTGFDRHIADRITELERPRYDAMMKGEVGMYAARLQGQGPGGGWATLLGTSMLTHPLVIQNAMILGQRMIELEGMEATWIALRGWMALEAGANADARKALEQVMASRWPPARLLAALGLEWLNSTGESTEVKVN